MRIVSNINGNEKVTSYGDKLFFNNMQIKRGFYRESVNSEFVQVYLYDETPPEINVTSPYGNDNILTSEQYTLTGEIIDTESGPDSLTINGVAVQLNNGSFSKNYSLSNGKNSFTLVATDIAGNSSTLIISVVRKNTSVITWADTITGSSSGGMYVYNGGISYSGDRNSNNCSCTAGTNYYSIYRDPEGHELASYATSSNTITGRIFAGAKTLSFSASFNGSTPDATDRKGAGCTIYNAAGQAVANMAQTSNNISQYSDGTYYFRASASYTQYRQGWHVIGAHVSISISP